MEIVIRLSGKAKDVFPAIRRMVEIAGEKLTIADIAKIKGGDKNDQQSKTIS